MLYELSDQQVKNLTTFLQRVDLKGNEAISLVSIFQSIAKHVEIETPKTVVKPQKKEKIAKHVDSPKE